MPEEKKPILVVKAPKEVAGGIPAVTSAMSFITKQVGFFRGIRTLSRLNQRNGFDCPGCAWPEPEDRRALAEFCENGAKAVAEEATKKRVTREFFAEWTVSKLNEQTDYWLGQQGRLTEPMILKPGAEHYVPIGWEEAFQLIADELKGLASPDEAAFYTSGRTSNEAAFLYQLLVRKFGTNNLPDCSNLCHESSGVGLSETIGSGKGTVLLSDFEKADLIFVVGQNPGTNHPRMLTALQGAARRGCKIVSINPLRETGLRKFKHPQEFSGVFGGGTSLSSMDVRVRINGDVAVFQGIGKAILEAEDKDPGRVLDWAFLRNHTDGFEAWAKHINTLRWADIVDSAGVPEAQIREVAKLAMASKGTIVCWAMGLTQHKNAVANIQEIVNFLCLRGDFGKPGAGACPVRGHSNVQGDRTMGIWEKPGPAFLDALKKEFDFEPPRRHGFDVVDSIMAMLDGRVKVFFAVGGNFLSASPDTDRTEQALRRCRLTVQVSTKLNRSHLANGTRALILPCLGRTEADRGQFVSVENSMGVVHSSVGRLPPASPYLLSEVQVLCGLAKPLLGEDWWAYAENYDTIRERIERVIPGFEKFNERIRRVDGFTLPHPVRDGRHFATATGRAHFTVHPLPRHELKPGQYLMMTIRSHDQYNTTIYGLDDRYRGVYQGRRVVFINGEDLKAAGLANGGKVDLIGHHNGEERIARDFTLVEYDIPRKCVASYFPETNVLVPVDSFADKSQTPTSKSIIVSLRPA